MNINDVTNAIKQIKQAGGETSLENVGLRDLLKLTTARGKLMAKAHPYKALGLGAAAVGVPTAAAIAAKKLLGKNKKKSSLFDEDFVNSVADSIIKQAAGETSLENVGLRDLLKLTTARGKLMAKAHPYKALGLGAAAVGVPTAAAIAAKKLLGKNKKKSSLFDEDFVNLVADSIIKQASEEDGDGDQTEEFIDAVSAAIQKKASDDEPANDITAEDVLEYLASDNTEEEDETKLAADIIADAIIQKEIKKH
jgi:hypothetical protein